MSTLLYHGPRSREIAVDKAMAMGRMLAPPFGDDGLKVAIAREIVETLSSVPLGDQLGTVVIGPFDSATPEASDSLLKVLEEFDGRYLQPLLWAKDAGLVSGTIRSRCLLEWCPSQPGFSPEQPFLERGRKLCESALRRRTASVLELLKENDGCEAELFRASAEILATKEDWNLEVRLRLWESLREHLVRVGRRDPTPLAAQSAFLI
jgi:hypothetical protein